MGCITKKVTGKLWLKNNNYRNYGDCCGNCNHVIRLDDGCLKCNHPDLQVLSLRNRPKVDLIHVCNRYNDDIDKVLIESEESDFIESQG